jgi:hypothetical protein
MSLFSFYMLGKWCSVLLCVMRKITVHEDDPSGDVLTVDLNDTDVQLR